MPSAIYDDKMIGCSVVYAPFIVGCVIYSDDNRSACFQMPVDAVDCIFLVLGDIAAVMLQYAVYLVHEFEDIRR